MKILFVDPHESSIFSFRKEVLDELISQHHEVIICTNVTEKITNEYKDKAKKIINVPQNLKDKNPFTNLKLLFKYRKVIKKEKPDLILSYKIKPNIYCGFFAKKCLMIANVTGLGKIFEKNGILSKIGLFLYRKSFKNVDFVFFQNDSGKSFFLNKRIPVKQCRVIPGSGVNADTFIPTNIEPADHNVNFLFASRAIKEKGYDLLLDAIPLVISKTTDVKFNFLCAEENIFKDKRLNSLKEKYPGNISLIDRSDDMRKVYCANNYLIAPSFYKEGISNVLLESLACERPIITTNDNPGCMEVLEDGINGFGVRSNNLDDLANAILKAVNTPKEKAVLMGKEGRKFVVSKFNRKDVVDAYVNVISALASRN